MEIHQPAGSGSGATLTVTDGVHTVTPVTIIDFVSGATVSNAGGGQANVTVAGGTGITVGSTTITSGSTTNILYDNAGVVGEYTITGSGTVVAMQTAPIFVTSIQSPKIIGGSGTTGTQLIIQTTTGTGTTDVITFAGGANGGTTFATLGATSFNTGTSSTFTAGTIELGNVSDTTISRSGAGVIAVEGVVIPSISSTNTLTNKTLTSPVINTSLSGTAFGTGVTTWLATPSSANLAAAVTDETGSGLLVFATSPTLVTPVLGAATATSINKMAITAPATSSTLAVADGKTATITQSITFSGTDSTTMTFPSSNQTLVGTTNTTTISNKRFTRRTATTNAPGATPTTNSDNVDYQVFTGLATAITSMTTNLSGTPTAGDFLEFWLTDNGTARAITWGASFAATTVALPTTTVISTKLRVLFEWGGSTWDCVAIA